MILVSWDIRRLEGSRHLFDIYSDWLRVGAVSRTAKQSNLVIFQSYFWRAVGFFFGGSSSTKVGRRRSTSSKTCRRKSCSSFCRRRRRRWSRSSSTRRTSCRRTMKPSSGVRRGNLRFLSHPGSKCSPLTRNLIFIFKPELFFQLDCLSYVCLYNPLIFSHFYWTIFHFFPHSLSVSVSVPVSLFSLDFSFS